MRRAVLPVLVMILSSASAAAAAEPALAAPLDLLALVQLPQHVVQGEWKREGSTLIGSGKAARIEIPVAPPKEYDLTIRGRMTGTGIAGIKPGLIARGRQFYAVFGTAACALCDDNVYRAPNHVPGIRAEVLKRPFELTCAVRDDSVTLKVNGLFVLQYQGDFSPLKVDAVYAMPQTDHLFLGLSGTAQWEIAALTLSPPAPPVAAIAAFAPPAGSMLGLVGRMSLTQSLTNVDVGLLLVYPPGNILQHDLITPYLGVNGEDIVAEKAVRIELGGLLHVPRDMEVTVWHAGGSTQSGQNSLLLDGAQIGIVGDATKNVAYHVTLKQGEHVVGWKIIGGNIGNSLLQFFDPETHEPLTLYTPPAMVATLKRLPTDSQLDVVTAQPLPRRPANFVFPGPPAMP